LPLAEREDCILELTQYVMEYRVYLIFIRSP
jgi:hypothetical protein